MALSEKERPYETMIRHHADGTIGAHHQTITEILRDKVVIQATVNEPIPLAVADGQGGLSLADVMGEAATLALKENERLTGELATSALSLEQTRGQLEQATNEIAQLETAGGEQAVRITEYERRIDQYNTEASDLRAQIALLKEQLAAVTASAQEADVVEEAPAA